MFFVVCFFCTGQTVLHRCILYINARASAGGVKDRRRHGANQELFFFL